MELINATKNDSFEEVFSLLTSGYKASSRDKDNATPLYWSACRGNVQLCELLIQARSDVNAQVKWGSTALHAATDRGHVECVDILLECGAEVNVQNGRGDTALHIASYRGFKKISQILVRNGANLFLKNDAGKTARDEAVGGGHTDIADYLAQAMRAGYHMNIENEWEPSQDAGTSVNNIQPNMRVIGSLGNNSLSDSPLSSVEGDSVYRYHDNRHDVGWRSNGNNWESEAIEHQERVYNSGVSESTPGSTEIFDDAGETEEHSGEITEQLTAGDKISRPYNRQYSIDQSERPSSNQHTIRRSNSTIGCRHDVIPAHMRHFANNGPESYPRDNTKQGESLRGNAYGEQKQSNIVFPLIRAEFGEILKDDRKSQSVGDLSHSNVQYDIARQQLLHLGNASHAFVHAHRTVDNMSKLCIGDTNNIPTCNTCVHVINESPPANINGVSPRSTAEPLISVTPPILHDYRYICRDNRYSEYPDHTTSSSSPDAQHNCHVPSPLSVSLPLSHCARSNEATESTQYPNAATTPIPTSLNSVFVPDDRTNPTCEPFNDLRRQLIESNQKCESIKKENDSLVLKYWELVGMVKKLEKTNEEKSNECERFEVEINGNKLREDGDSGTSERTGPKHMYGSILQEKDIETQKSLERILQVCDQKDDMREVCINEQGLKAELHRRVIAVSAPDVLDTPGREWTPGIDYVILGDKPISGQNTDEGVESTTMTFSIKHIKSGQTLHLKMAWSLTMIDKCNPSTQKPSTNLLDGLAHRNIDSVLHHYSGSTDRFRRFLPAIPLAARGCHQEAQGNSCRDIWNMAYFTATTPYPYSLLTYAEGFMRNSQLDQSDSEFGIIALFCLQLLCQLLSALTYLHDKGIVHRAISPDTILLDNMLRPVITNFAHALRVTGDDNRQLQFRSKDQITAGHPCAWSPELVYFHQSGPPFQNQISLKDIYNKADLFALGQLFYCIISGYNGNDVYFLNRQTSALPLPPPPTSLPGGLVRVINGMVIERGSDRPTVQQCRLMAGVLLRCSQRPEVITNQGACRVSLTARMLELVTTDVARNCKRDPQQAMSLEESVPTLRDEIEADFLCNTDSKEFWETYGALKNFLPVNYH